MSVYDVELKRKTLKGYLKSFYVPVDKKLIILLDNENLDPLKCDYFIFGSRKYFRPLIAYYLVENGRKDWITFNAYELIEIYLGKCEEYNSIFDLNASYAIITYGNEEFENKRQWDVINQYIAWRQLDKKRTIIYGFNRRVLSEFKEKMPIDLRQGFKVINLFDWK
ncbi:MAG TPA: hypothetical protein ENI23_11755 [bacterium]|nr:hypothetical protein [bacterium]